MGLALLLPWAFSMEAQKPATYLKPGDKAAAAGDWTMAYSCYEQAFLLDSSDFEIGWRYAEAARHIKYYDLASRLYERLYEKDKGRLHPEGLFWLASMLKFQGRYEDAQRNFRKFHKKHKKADKLLLARAVQEEQSALWALNYKENDDALEKVYGGLLASVLTDNCRFTALRPVRMDGAINTADSETSPSVHNGVFYFSRHQSGRWSLMKADMTPDDSNQSFFRFSNEQFADSSSASVQYANAAWYGDTLWCTQMDASGIGLLEKRPAGAQRWPAGGGSHYDSQPAVTATADGLRLYFVSDRAGGIGGLDIWFSDNRNGVWAAPRNAGDVVNTPGDELSPFALGGYLFFSSDWHEGFGGLDVFCAADLGGVFDKPLNLGKSVNSPQHDMFFWTDPVSGRYFFSSNREGATGSVEGAYCCHDLYGGIIEADCSEIAEDKLEVLMDELPVKLYFHNDEPNPDSWDTTSTVSYSDAFASYLALVPQYEKENARGLEGDAREGMLSVTRDFFDLHVKKGMADLERFAPLLLDELNQGKHIRLSVRGFASPRAQTDYNVNLTRRRIASLINYLSFTLGGAIKPYLDGTAANGGKLEVEQLPFGEYRSDKRVSDDLVNERASIYSRGACMERKIEIELVTLLPPVVKPELVYPPVYQLGTIRGDSIITFEIPLTNPTALPVQIDHVAASCGCTTPVLEKSILAPGETIRMTVGFDPRDRQGEQHKEVYLFIRGEIEPRVVLIEGVVE